MHGLFISFEGTEGSGKSTQIRLLADRLRQMHYTVREIREPGGTSIGEEVRKIVKHGIGNAPMSPETELLLMNASRAQLVREVIRPALAAAEVVLSDRFYDSTVAYQAYGRGLDLELVTQVIDFAVGNTRPNLTLLLHIPPSTSEARRQIRNVEIKPAHDRFEKNDQEFFSKVESGYKAIATAEPTRVKVIDGSSSVEKVAIEVWAHVETLIARTSTAVTSR